MELTLLLYGHYSVRRVHSIDHKSPKTSRMKKLYLILLGILCLASTSLVAQIQVTGTVTDPNGEPLIGAGVTIKGTSQGTITDFSGMYSITVPDGSTVLVFSYTGYTQAERPVGTDTKIDFVLQEGVLLGETVITALGISRDRSQLGYGVAEISSQELTRAKTTNVTNSLAGKVAGVRVQGSGGSFAGSSIIIRGLTTFTQSNQPLFVIDGIPIDNSGGGNPLQNGPVNSNRAIDINQEDVENVTVLKGPAAAALYGSRASNGVILITTKKGAKGKRGTITYSTSYAWDQVNRTPDYQNEYAQGTGGNYNNTSFASWGPQITGQQVTNWFGETETLTAYPDNVNDIFRTGSNMQHNLSFAGGSDRSSYRLSYGYLDESGILQNNRLQRHNLTFNANSQITDKLLVSTSATYTNNASTRSQQGNQLANPLFRGWFIPRSYNLTDLPFEDAIGNQRYFGGEDHVYWTLKHNKYSDEINRIYGNVAVRYDFTSWLSGEYKIGVDMFDFVRSGYDQIGSRGGANTTANGLGGVLEGNDLSRNLNSYFTLTATRQLSDDLNLVFLVGTEAFKNLRQNTLVIGRGLVVRDFQRIQNTSTFTPTYNSTENRLVGVFADASLSYKNFLNLNLTARNDWSSTFNADNRSYFYYAVAAALNILELQPSWKGGFVNSAKLRTNYAQVGKPAPSYSTLTYFGIGGSADGFGPQIVYPFGGLTGLTLGNGAGNPLIGPEFTTNFEIGTDIALWDNRVNLEFTWYNQKSKDIILAAPTAPSAGVSSFVRNAGEIDNKGIELGLSVTPLRTSVGTWTVGVNFTKFTSTVTALSEGVTNIFLGGFVTPNVRLVEGDDFGQIYGNQYLRNADGRILLNANGLPRITTGVDKIGNPNPDWLMGVTNTLTFGGFTFDFLLDIKKGGQIYSRNIADLERNGVAASTAEFPRFNADGTPNLAYKFDGLLPDGSENNVFVTAEQYFGNAGKYVAAEGFIYGTSWFRVREASISYRIPKRMLGNLPFSGIEIGAFGRNLFLYAPDYPHLDPEQNALGISNAQGLEFNALPPARSIGVNLRVTL